MRKLDVDWADLELAFRDATGAESYLDLESGEVETIVPGFLDEQELRDRVRQEPQRFVHLEPLDTGFTRSALEAFVATLPSGSERRALEAAQRKVGGLTRAMELLEHSTSTLEAFHRFEQGCLWAHIEGVLRSAGVVPCSVAPSVELFEGPGRASGIG